MWVLNVFLKHCLEMTDVIILIQGKSSMKEKNQKNNGKQQCCSVGFKNPQSMKTAAVGT